MAKLFYCCCSLVLLQSEDLRYFKPPQLFQIYGIKPKKKKKKKKWSVRIDGVSKQFKKCNAGIECELLRTDI